MDTLTPQHRFGIMVWQDSPMPTLLERFRRVEELGFDQLYLPDHIGDFRDLSKPLFDAYPTLAAAAMDTERIRLGTLVSNPILRSPALLANEMVALDHLSGGRVELGIGAGVFEFDHHAVGSEPWTLAERLQRFEEYLQILDGIMTSGGKPYSFDGRHLWVRDAPTAPSPVQEPRVPITVGGQAPTILRLAAQHADVWNTNGAYGAGIDIDAGVDEVVERTRQQNRRLDELCEEHDRDPATLRRSLLFEELTREAAEQFIDAGIQDFVIAWPSDDQADQIEALAADLFPTFR